jgi:hypothetical protein
MPESQEKPVTARTKNPYFARMFSKDYDAHNCDYKTKENVTNKHLILKFISVYQAGGEIRAGTTGPPGPHS